MVNSNLYRKDYVTAVRGVVWRDPSTIRDKLVCLVVSNSIELWHIISFILIKLVSVKLANGITEFVSTVCFNQWDH